MPIMAAQQVPSWNVAGREHGKVERTSTDPEKQISKYGQEEWKPGRGEWLILICLTILSLVVSLDATILVPVLPVCFIH
jgi:hypothetical protein